MIRQASMENPTPSQRDFNRTVDIYHCPKCDTEIKVPAAPVPAGMVPWEPYLHNYADAVDGHYCIARYNPSGYCEFLNKGKWCSAGEVIVIPDHRKTIVLAAAEEGKS